MRLELKPLEGEKHKLNDLCLLVSSRCADASLPQTRAPSALAMTSGSVEAAQVCDEKCQKRAKAGEVVIVSIVLVVALISGE